MDVLCLLPLFLSSFILCSENRLIFQAGPFENFERHYQNQQQQQQQQQQNRVSNFASFYVPTASYQISRAPILVPIPAPLYYLSYTLRRIDNLYPMTIQNPLTMNPAIITQRYPAIITQRPGVIMQQPFVLLPVVHPMDVLKNSIYSAIKSDPQSCASATSVGLNLRSFLYELDYNHLSASLPAETHLNWFVEFVTSQHYAAPLHENLLDYFSYIKSRHLTTESLQDDVGLYIVIDVAIKRLIGRRCIVPEVISELLKLMKDNFNRESGAALYNCLLQSIREHEPSLSLRGQKRYLTVIEAFLEFIPEISYVNSILDESEASFPGTIRIVLHLAPIYQILMGFVDAGEEDINFALISMIRFYNFKLIPDFNHRYYVALNTILKRALYHIQHCDLSADVFDTLVDKYERAAIKIANRFNLDHFYNFFAFNLSNLMDVFLMYTIPDPSKSVDFVWLVLAAYRYSLADRLVGLNQISIYLANHHLDLEHFRIHIKPKLLEVDEHFLLVLEALIAAVEDVNCNPANYKSWEPSGHFLELQQEILSVQIEGNPKNSFHIIDSPFLILAAKIFLSRQTGLPYAFFSSTFDYDGVSWADAVSFVNFYLDRIYPGQVRIKSQFCEDIALEFGLETPKFDDIMRIYASKAYFNQI